MTLARLEDVYFTLVLGLVIFARAVPPARDPLARALGAVAYRVSSTKRRRTRAALGRAIGDALSPADEEQAVRGPFVAFWRGMLEWRPAGPVEVVGLEHLRSAIERGRGAILWESRGFGLRDVAGETLHDHGFILIQVHGPRHLGGFLTHAGAPNWLRRRVVRPFFDRRELRWAAEIVNLPGDQSLAFTRALAERLRDNQVLCVTGDGPEGYNHLTLPFLGSRERFATGMASLARATCGALLPLFCYLDRDGRCRLVIEPPIDVASGDREVARTTALARYAELLEGYVRRHPDQYRTWHILSPPAGVPAQERTGMA